MTQPRTVRNPLERALAICWNEWSRSLENPLSRSANTLSISTARSGNSRISVRNCYLPVRRVFRRVSA
jgi:hypothetical protein